MKYVEFGSTGVKVSEMCLGTMMFGDRCSQDEADRILSAAIEAGVNFIDTAASYCQGETERILGNILAGKDRQQLFIGTKVTKTTAADWILQSIDESLSRMRLDYVDLYMIHWPRENMEPEKMMEALNKVVQQGKARFVGCCNFPAWLLAHCNAIAERNGWAKLVCNQIPYNLVERGVEVEVLPQAQAENIAITVYRALLMGFLAGKYNPDSPIPEDSRGRTDTRIAVWLEKFGPSLRQYLQFAADRNLHPAQLAIAWVRHSPAVTSPIVGVSSLSQLEASLKAFDVELSDEEYETVTGFFDTAVKEETGGSFPALRRSFKLVAR
ncbi:MAG: aldo/keto reductase [Chloroflexi bacterium]|nr:MAG: aldo/keto reductase [Chloroflexota bacterium]